MRVIIVANRLPVNLQEEEGKFIYRVSPGGIISSLYDFISNFNINGKKIESLWVGWPGKPVPKKLQPKISKDLQKKFHSLPVFLTQKQIDEYYLGFSNKTIWPLFHYFSDKSKYNAKFWYSYKAANKQFADEILKIIKPDDLIFIQDYQLMILPKLLKDKLPQHAIGFFLHIPFPSYEIFRMLPEDVKKGIVNGLIGADLVAFHTNDYTQHFLDTVYKILGIKHSAKTIQIGSRSILIENNPLGINYEKYISALNQKKIQKEISDFKKNFKGKKIIFSVDRLDYTKGIKNRLLGFEMFLNENPKFRGKVTMILIAQPSRVEIEDYQQLKQEVDQIVGRINSSYENLAWRPIIYQYTSLGFEEMIVRYNLSDIGLVTPLRDGMNLVSKEYVASKPDKLGVLILSETAGSAKELTQAILVNPNNIEEISQAILKALNMTPKEQMRRMSSMHNLVKQFTSERWAKESIDKLNSIAQILKGSNIPLTDNLEKLLADYQKGSRRLIFLDYDGTLVDYAKKPELASPPKKVLNILKDLAADFKNELVIISGRDKDSLLKWIDNPKIALVAEHGMWIRERNQYYYKPIKNLSNRWKIQFKPILEKLVERIPKSFIEDKDYSLVWHYRSADQVIIKQVLPGILEELQLATENTNLEILEGVMNLEIKDRDITKGHAALEWLSRKKYDFILALGDDRTDEDLFEVLPKGAYTIKVGANPSQSKYTIPSYDFAIKLLELLAQMS